MNKAPFQFNLNTPKQSAAPPFGIKYSEDSLRCIGLFAGIGGIECGLGSSEHKSEMLCEIDASAAAVLSERFPNVSLESDVRDIRSIPRGTQLVAAGFPCQDLSQAGKTAGIAGSRSSLIGEVFRLLEHRRAEWLLLENVPFMLQLAHGKALHVILAEIERLGYKWAYRVVNSRAFGLPQRRERVFILASIHNDPRNVLFVDEVRAPVDTRGFREVACGFYWTEGLRGLGWAVDSVPTLKGGSTIGIPSPPAIIFPSGLVAKPDIRDVERMQGFSENWTQPAEQVAKKGVRWKLVGNAVTVNAAAWIGRRLRNPGEYDQTGDLPLRASKPWPTAAWNTGNGRYVAQLSPWPQRIPAAPLEDFLRYPVEPLSTKATAGFLSRAQAAKLRFPSGFLDALRHHLAVMQGVTRSCDDLKNDPARQEEEELPVTT